MTGYVYFIRPKGKAGPIKVGHSTFPPVRLISLQAWSYEELEIVSQIEGYRRLERDIHERFAKYQIRGEWFEAAPELVALAEGIRDGRPLAELVDLSIVTGKLYRRPNTKSPNAKIVGMLKMRVVSATRHAKRVYGRSVSVPRNVQKILSTAGGYKQPYRTLSSEEIAVIEAFIAECRAPAVKAAVRSSQADDQQRASA